MLCNSCGLTISNSVDRCPYCGAVTRLTDTASVRSSSAPHKHPFFSAAGDLSSFGKKSPESAVESITAEAYTCPVCTAKATVCPCPRCGFDSSCDYEKHPTLQLLDKPIPSVSSLKAKQHYQPISSLEETMSFLQQQGWDANVLSSVKQLLSSAKNDLRTKHSAPNTSNHQISALSCSHCGTVNTSESLFCGCCGARLNAPSPVPNGTKTAFKNTAQSVHTVHSQFCHCCGTPVSSDSLYCAVCGAKII